MRNIKRMVNELSLLFEISRALNKDKKIDNVFLEILELLKEYINLERAVITILNRETGEIISRSAIGLSENELKRGRYKIGEGVTGRVIQSGKPKLIYRISDEPQFLNKTKVRTNLIDKLSFICIPIKFKNEVIGAISADRQSTTIEELKNDEQILITVCNLIAESVKSHQQELEEISSLQQENFRLQNELFVQYHPKNIIGSSSLMRELYRMIKIISETDSTVLIRGESGVGKELVAHAIHYQSNRKDKAFVKVNCAALPIDLIESELFGYEKGAFTGAEQNKIGKFEVANGGTIFLDEIGELPILTQVKLLRVLQELEIERIGSNKPIKIDVRILCATNRDLEESIEKGEFREDLFYRINVFPIYIPPLRERENDVIELANYFLDKYSKEFKKVVSGFTDEAKKSLLSYNWPGNVRELKNYIERAVILSNNPTINTFNLPGVLQINCEKKFIFESQSLESRIDKYEYELINEALLITRGNISHAAKLLQITERKLGLRIKKYTINVLDYKK